VTTEFEAQRLRLRQLRDEFKALSLGHKPTTSLESIEWERLHLHTRMLILMAAGVDGDLESLALRNWHELPRPEQQAVNIEIRGLRNQLMGLVALARHV
jgi:hypothetical protein